MMRSFLAVVAASCLAIAACEPQDGTQMEETPGATEAPETAPMPTDSPAQPGMTTTPDTTAAPQM